MYLGARRQLGDVLAVQRYYRKREISNLARIVVAELGIETYDASYVRDKKRVFLALPNITVNRIGIGDNMADLVESLRGNGMAGPYVRCKYVLLPYNKGPVAAVYLESSKGEVAPGRLAKGPYEIGSQVLRRRVVDFVRLTAVVSNILIRLPGLGDRC